MPERALASTSTSAFPSDPCAPERAELKKVYLPLRGS